MLHEAAGADPPSNDDQEDEEGPAVGSPRVKLSDLKHLCLICGDIIKDEKDENYNSCKHLAKEVEMVFR